MSEVALSCRGVGSTFSREMLTCASAVSCPHMCFFIIFKERERGGGAGLGGFVGVGGGGCNGHVGVSPGGS